VRACGCVPDTIVATITAGRRPGSLHDSDFYGRGGRQAQLATQKMTALEGKAPADSGVVRTLFPSHPTRHKHLSPCFEIFTFPFATAGAQARR